MSKPLYQPQGPAKALSVANRYRNMTDASPGVLGKKGKKGKLIGLSYNDLEIKITNSSTSITKVTYNKQEDVYRGTDKDTGEKLERLGTSEFWYKAEEAERMQDTIKMYRKLGRRL